MNSGKLWIVMALSVCVFGCGGGSGSTSSAVQPSSIGDITDPQLANQGTNVPIVEDVVDTNTNEDVVDANANASVDAWTAYMSTSRDQKPAWAQSVRRGFSMTKMPDLLAQGDVIATINGPQEFISSLGNSDEALAAYVTMLQQEGADGYKAAVYAAAVETVALERSTGNTVYWLLGNEINSKAKSTSWEPYAVGTQTGLANDQSYIPAFAEIFMAPVIETIVRAEADTGADIRVMMGSIANGSGNDQRAWASALLNYTFVGTYAPSLAGRKVSEFMERLAFHYSITDSNWEDTLDYYFGLSGNRGVFDTEEIGEQAMAAGYGPNQALLGFARVLHWAIKHDRSADEVRINYWSEGQSFADETMTLLSDFLGDVPIAEINAPIVTATGELETYAFEAQGKRALLIFNGVENAAVSLTGVRLDVQQPVTPGRGTLHVITPDPASAGLTSSAATIATDAEGVAIEVNVQLPDNGAALLLLE